MSYQLRPARTMYWLRLALSNPGEAVYCIPRRMACRFLDRHNVTCRGRTDHPRTLCTDNPRHSTSCWSRAEVGTPDAVIHDVACSRGRHRWGKHRNRHVRWSCPRRCGCVRHARR